MKEYCYNLDDAEFFNSYGEKLASCVPELCYQEHAVWRIFLRNRDNQPRDFTGVVAWSAAVDCDFKVDSPPMCRALPEDISADPTAGSVTVRLNAATSEFLAAVGASPEKSAYFELYGMNSVGERVICLCFRIGARMTIDPDPEVDVHTPDTMATKTYTQLAISDALASGGYITSSGAQTIASGAAGSAVSGAIFSGAEIDTMIGPTRITAASGGVLVSAGGMTTSVGSGGIVASGENGETMIVSEGAVRIETTGVSAHVGEYNVEIEGQMGDVSIRNFGNVMVDDRQVLTALATSTDTTATSAGFAVLDGGVSYVYTQPLTSIGIREIAPGCRAELDFTAGAGFDLSLPASAKRFGVSSYDSGGHYLIAVDGARVVVNPYTTGA